MEMIFVPREYAFASARNQGKGILQAFQANRTIESARADGRQFVTFALGYRAGTWVLRVSTRSRFERFDTYGIDLRMESGQLVKYRPRRLPSDGPSPDRKSPLYPSAWL